MGRILFTPHKDLTPTPFPVHYGLLFNWYAANHPSNIASAGWRMPTQSDFVSLTTYIGASTQGGKLKETGLTYWQTPNTNASNEMLFNARGAGNRNFSSGAFAVINQYWYCWTSTDPVGSSTCNYFRLEYNNGNLTGLSTGDLAKKYGYSVRLIKETTTLSHGQTGTYTGNDGKIYRTICIGTQEWLADNLAETKFRNGDWIHGYDGGVYTPISNTDWANLTSAGVCCYNDDTSYI